jgi:anti-sigma regulatory factor (Ser/Thr protein kinase)
MVGADIREGYFLLKGGEFAEAGAASRELRSVLSRLGVPQDVIRRAAICAFEAEMNVIIHAVAGSLHYVVDDDKITITVTDMGPGIEDIDLAMQEGYSTAPQWAVEMGWGSGLGLPNIKKNSDSLKIDSVVGEGTTLEILVRIDGGQNTEASSGKDNNESQGHR